MKTTGLNFIEAAKAAKDGIANDWESNVKMPKLSEWTQEPPTEKGWYWLYSNVFNMGTNTIIRVFVNPLEK